MALKNMKPWQKIALGVVTVGITATAIYFSVKGIKKMIAANKKKNDSKTPIEKEVLLPSEKKTKADQLAMQIRNKYDGVNKQVANLTPNDNTQIQGWKDELKKLGFGYDNGKAIA